MLKFIKTWTLPIAMLLGMSVYLLFAHVSVLNPVKPFMYTVIGYLTPSLIFAQLLLTFCKISPRELLPTPWHGWLLLFQLLSTCLFSAALLWLSVSLEQKIILEAGMVCLICPTATAAAVITGKLGGSASSLTTYTLLSNLLAAVAVPLLFPLVEPHANLSFFSAFLVILSKVFPLLLCPFLLACLLRSCLRPVHRWLLSYHEAAFYLWAVALAIVTGQTVRSLCNSEAEPMVEIWIAGMGLLTCALQFYLGKRIGSRYADRISAGQALGQKNTVLAIWMAYTYLNPLSSVGPGSYVLWQNMFNSWQLWKKGKKDSLRQRVANDLSNSDCAISSSSRIKNRGR